MAFAAASDTITIRGLSPPAERRHTPLAGHSVERLPGDKYIDRGKVLLTDANPPQFFVNHLPDLPVFRVFYGRH